MVTGTFFLKIKVDLYGVHTDERPRRIKNGLHRIVWRCSNCTETAMPLGTVATVSVSVSNSVNVPLIACVLICACDRS